MLTLQEVDATARNYRFKFDNNTETYTLINTITKQPVVEKDEVEKAKRCILLSQLIYNGVVPTGGLKVAGVDDRFFGTDDLSVRREMFFNTLIKEIPQIVESGNFNASQTMIGTCSLPIDFFISSYKSIPSHLQQCYNSLLNHIMQERGIVVDDFKITHRTDLVGKTSFTCSTHKIINSQNANTTQQTNSVNKKIVSRKFVETLIEKYKQCEDDQNFEVRSNNEDVTMQRVVQVLDSSQPPTQIPNDFHKFMRMLISAQNLSIMGERDFLKEIVMQDAVNQRLLQYENDHTMQKIDSLINQKQSKQEKLGHKETRGEIARRITNSCIEHNDDQFKQLKHAIQNNKSLTFESSLEGDRFKRIAELYATTQGKFDMFKDTENSIT